MKMDITAAQRLVVLFAHGAGDLGHIMKSLSPLTESKFNWKISSQLTEPLGLYCTIADDTLDDLYHQPQSAVLICQKPSGVAQSLQAETPVRTSSTSHYYPTSGQSSLLMDLLHKLNPVSSMTGHHLLLENCT